MSAEEAIRRANNEWVASVNAGDIEDLIRRVDDDVAFIPPGVAAVVGRDAFAEFGRGMFSAMDVRVGLSDATILASNDQGCLRGTATIAMTPGEGGKTIEDVITYVHVFKLQPNGAWKMAVNIWNSDVPAEGH
jgi:ketosteroid isomerase-like protein